MGPPASLRGGVRRRQEVGGQARCVGEGARGCRCSSGAPPGAAAFQGHHHHATASTGIRAMDAHVHHGGDYYQESLPAILPARTGGRRGWRPRSRMCARCRCSAKRIAWGKKYLEPRCGRLRLRRRKLSRSRTWRRCCRPYVDK